MELSEGRKDIEENKLKKFKEIINPRIKKKGQGKKGKARKAELEREKIGWTEKSNICIGLYRFGTYWLRRYYCDMKTQRVEN